MQILLRYSNRNAKGSPLNSKNSTGATEGALLRCSHMRGEKISRFYIALLILILKISSLNYENKMHHSFA